jgi:hypothetical protein
MVLALWIGVASMPVKADPPALTGQWYGTWEIDESSGWTSNFSMIFWDSPYGLLAIMYVPDLGLFDEPLPVAIDETPAGYVVTIGIPGIAEMGGLLDGNSIDGSFYAFLNPDPPYFYTGTWQAEKYTGQPVLPGEAPGPACDNLPPLYCTGDAGHCGELLHFDPPAGPGYLDYSDPPRQYSYLRRDLMYLVKYATAKTACKTADWDYGNFAPLGLGDMSEEDGATPGTSSGYLRHPAGSHTDGRDIDTAYYQLFAADNLLRPVGMHYDGYAEAYHLVGPPYALDPWRTALYVACLSEHPRLRVIGVDGQIGPVLEEALDTLVDLGWLDAGLRESIPLVYEEEDMGWGFYYFHHHHMHISMNPVYDVVTAAEIGPQTLNRRSEGRFVTAHVELIADLDPGQTDADSVALILNGHTMLYAQPENVRLSDFNENGIADLTVKFDRQDVLAAIGNGEVEIAITGLVDGVFFQEADTLRVLGASPLKGQGQAQDAHPTVPFRRPGDRGI